MFQMTFPAVLAEADRLARSDRGKAPPMPSGRRAVFGRRSGSLAGDMTGSPGAGRSRDDGAAADGIRSAFLADVRRVAESHASAAKKHAMLIDLLQHYREGFLADSL